MNTDTFLNQYISICSDNLTDNSKIISLFKKNGIYERFIFENFGIGYSSGNITELIGDNEDFRQKLSSIGIIKNGKEIFKNYITIPIYDEDKTIINIVGINIFPQTKHNKMILLNNSGIFNQTYLRNTEEIIFTKDPIEAFLLIQNDYHNTTYMMTSDTNYIQFFSETNIKKAIFTFEGKSKLFYELGKNGVSTERIIIDFNNLKNGTAKEYLEKIFISESKISNIDNKDIITEIEKGFLFTFPHLKYRIIGNFTDYTMNLKTNIKVFTDSEVFVDVVDLYRNRERQNLVYNILDKFSIRDQVQIEQDLNQIIEVIEKYREKQKKDSKKGSVASVKYIINFPINLSFLIFIFLESFNFQAAKVQNNS